VTTKQAERFTVSAAHSGRVILTDVAFAEVEELLMGANIDPALVRSLDTRELVVLDAYRVVRIA
jgi:hypothetical protein